MLIFNSPDIRPNEHQVGESLLKIIEGLRIHTIEYKHTVNNLQAQITELEQSHAKKIIELQETLASLQEADDMLNIKYAEFTDIGKEKNVNFTFDKTTPPEKMFDVSSLSSEEGSKTSSQNTPKSLRTNQKKKHISLKNIFNARKLTDNILTGEEENKKLKTSLKYHKFLPHNYLTLKKCDMCLENMWGKELKCETCSYHCHIKCSGNITNDCQLARNSSQKNAQDASITECEQNKMDLIQIVKQDCATVPYFVTCCIQAIEKKGIIYFLMIKGITAPGIYRKSGKTSHINTIMSSLYKKEPISFDDPAQYIDISAITSALKQFLRDLPEPLIVKSIYDEITEITSNILVYVILENISAPKRAPFIKSLLKTMPIEHYNTLEYLIRHLAKY